MRVCVRIPETEVRPTGEKGTRAGVEVYEVYRSLSRVSWGFRVQFFASLFERTIFFSWRKLWQNRSDGRRGSSADIHTWMLWPVLGDDGLSPTSPPATASVKGVNKLAPLLLCAPCKPSSHRKNQNSTQWYVQQPTWRLWGEERGDGVIYTVYLKKVRYHRPTRSLSASDSDDEISHLEWETVRVRFLKAGTVQRLVESLANDDGELESTYINVFLATYRAFTTPREVLELLLARYDALDEGSGALTGEQHRKTLVQALHVWLDAYPGDWKSPPNHPLLSRLLDFTHRRLPGSELELKARHRLHRFQREDQIDSCMVYDNGRLPRGSPDPIVDHWTNYSFPEVPHRHFAEQLTRMDAEVFKKLVAHQCLGAVWSRRDRSRSHDAATVLATVNQFNAVSLRVISTILMDPTTKPQERARILETWIDIAQELRVLKNFSSLKAIVSGLQSNPVYRLEKCWQSMPREKHELFRELERIFSEENNAWTQRELLIKEGTAKFADTAGSFDAATAEKDTEEVTLDVPTTTESELLEQKYVAAGVSSESPEMSMQTSTPSIIQQTSMSTSSTSGVSIDTVVGKEKSDRHSPDSDSFEMVDKPDIIDDFVVIEEVGKEAEEYDSEGKSIRISSIPQASSKQYDRDLENLITENKQDSQVSTSQTSKNNELFDFESEESPPQVSNDDQYSQSYSDEEQYEGGKKWIEMQFHADPRVYDIEYDRGPLEDIKEEEITDFEAGSSRFGSLGSHKESIGSVGSMRGSFGSTPDYDVLTGKRYFTRPSDHDNVSLSSLQEFEHLESAVAAENSKRLQCGSHDSVNNGSLPRRYMTSRSGHGDDISLSSLKDFEGLEKACREAHLIELRAREEEDLLEHESPENKYKLESLPRTRIDTSTAGSFNASTSGSDDYEKRIKEIDEIIRIAQSNVEKFDRQDDTTEDISQIEITDVEKIGTQAGVQSISKPEEPETVLPLQRESNVMETSTDSLELEDNMDKKHHPLCRSSDSLEMKTTLDFPSLSSDSLNNVRDAKEMQSDVAEHASSVRRISSDSLDMPLLEPQDAESRERPSNEDDHSDGVTSDNSLEQRSETADTDKSDKMRTTPSTNT